MSRAPLVAALTALVLVIPGLASVPAFAQPAPAGEVTETTATLAPVAPGPLDLPPEAMADTSATVQHAEAQVSERIAVAAVVLPPGTDVEHVWMRQSENGQPGPWTEVELEEPPTAPAATAATTGHEQSVGTTPVVLAKAENVEVAVVSDAPVKASLQVYNAPASVRDSQPADYAWSSPAIRSRRSWGANESLVRYGYSYADVTGAMIHHTAGNNDYQPADVPAILRSIQAFHVNGRGWNDIAYNVLIDKFGQAWEGRGGGVARPVQGGHAFGVTNARVFGVSLIGDFTTMEPSSDTLTTLQRVIAWKLRMHNVDPYGKTWGSGGQDGGSTALNAISGHRDENATSCPGDRVYERLNDIRAGVRRSMDTEFTRNGLEGYDASNLMADAALFNPRALDREGIASFLSRQGAACVPGPDGTACLKDYRTTIPAKPAGTCKTIASLASATAADVFARVGNACEVNPQVLLALVEARQSLVTASGKSLTSARYAGATGAGCPDFGPCDPNRATFFEQVLGAGETLRATRAQALPLKAGQAAQVPYSQELECGAAAIRPTNAATAGLLNHVRKVPNAASLASGAGSGDQCSSNGLRDFYRAMRAWFPESVTAAAAPPVAPTPPSRIPDALKAVLAKAGETGAAALGAARGPLTCDSGTCRKEYERATIVWTATTGATVITPAARIAGVDRYATAVEVSKKGFPDGAARVFIATGATFADALTAGPWANRAGSPILLTAKDALPAVTQAELARLKPEKVVLLGGTAGVAAAVEATVRSVLPGADVARVQGPTRYETAVELSKTAFDGGTTTGAFLASGASFPDALVAGPLAGGSGPLLLVRNQGPADPDVVAELGRLGVNHVTVLGGAAAVPAAVETQLRALGITVERIAGANRYGTADAAAARAFPSIPERAYLASGENYPDALVSVGLQTSAKGPLLLARKTCIPGPTLAYLKSGQKPNVTLVGGEAALGVDVALLRGC